MPDKRVKLRNRINKIGGDESVPFGRFCLSRTMTHMGDGGVSIPS